MQDGRGQLKAALSLTSVLYFNTDETMSIDCDLSSDAQCCTGSYDRRQTRPRRS